MLKCKSCGREYFSEELLKSGKEGEQPEDQVFDGEALRYICPACGGLMYPIKERMARQRAA